MNWMNYTLVAAFGAIFALAACQTDDFPGAPPPAQKAAQKAACTAKGGTYDRAGMYGYTCYMPMPDAGKSCHKSGDCAGICYADTHQCSAVSPQFGCYGYLDEKGQKVEICVD